MRLRLFALSFALANLSYNGIEYAMTAQSEPRPAILSGEDMMRVLPGNTLIAFDESGAFWMYYPSPDTVWGQSSTGDVDVGRWWIEDGRYCRSWRLWYDGRTQCWLLASYGENRIVWMDGRESIQGESLVQPGNAIGSAWPPILASLATDIAEEPIAITGAIAPERQTQAADRGPVGGGTQSGSGSGGGSGGSSSSGGSSGGVSSGGDAGGGSSDPGNGKGETADHGNKGNKGDRGDKGGRGGGNGGGRD